jgi:ATP-binding cassette subfamily B protein
MMPVTKSHGLENVEINSFRKKILNLTGSGLEVDKTNANFGAWVWVINTFLSSACLVFCAALALNGIIKVGDIVLYQSMFSQICGGVSALTNMVPAFATGVEALSSVSEIMNATDVKLISVKQIFLILTVRLPLRTYAINIPTVWRWSSTSLILT